jgi:hypothetical protein
MRKWLKQIKGEHIAFTGTAWRIRRDLRKDVHRQGGVATSKGLVTGNTTVLVRGRWPNDEFGAKERKAAELMRGGHPISIVADFDFRRLLEKGRPAKVMDRVAGEPIEWLNAPSRKNFEKAANISGMLDFVHTALGRVEQGFLRHKLFEKSDEAVCALCGRRLPLSLMVAAHIKPRSECSRMERLDAENIVFGVCLLGCDVLYERGFISIGPKGKIHTASVHGSKALARLFAMYRGRICPAWKGTSAKYFEWHLVRRFQG